MSNNDVACGNSFKGKVVLITGSSNGIGRETARMFCSKGAMVTITGRNADTLKQTKKMCMDAGATEKNLFDMVGDLENDTFHEKLINETVKKFGKLDILVNNAGMCMIPREEGFEMDMTMFDRMMRVNCRAALSLARFAMQHLEKTKGCIVNVSSVAGRHVLFEGCHRNAYYAVSKAAMDQLNTQMAGQFMKRGIRVNCVNPGVIDTDLLNKQNTKNKDVLKKWGTEKTRVPMGRCGTPNDITKVIAWLADSTQSEFVVGQRITVDGGAMMKNCLLSCEDTCCNTFEANQKCTFDSEVHAK